MENCRWLFETENMDRFLSNGIVIITKVGNFNQMIFFYGKGGKFYTIQKNISPDTQNICQCLNVQFIKLKENSNFKSGQRF